MRVTPRVVAFLVAVLILLAGGAYVAKHHPTYQSSATFLLSPAPGTSPVLAANELSGFSTSGSSGTYVDLIDAADTARAAGLSGSGVTITARADPTARAIYVTAQGPQAIVQPALTRLVSATIAREPLVGDVFRLQLVDSPSAPTVSGPSRALLAVAVVVLALLGGLFVLVVLRRYPAAGARPAGTSVVLGGGGAPALGEADAYRVLGAPEVTFHLEAFRFVRASFTTTLMQVMGYWRGVAEDQVLPDPVLLVHDGHVAHVLASVATPGERPPTAGPQAPLWRASYAVPVEIFNRYQRLALRSGDVVVGLPQPTEQLSLRPAEPEEVEEIRRGIRRPGGGAEQLNGSEPVEPSADEAAEASRAAEMLHPGRPPRPAPPPERRGPAPGGQTGAPPPAGPAPSAEPRGAAQPRPARPAPPHRAPSQRPGPPRG